MIYQIILHIDLGKFSSEVGTMMDQVNETMHSFGFPETAIVTSELSLGTLTVSRPLTADEREQALNVLRLELSKHKHEAFLDIELR